MGWLDLVDGEVSGGKEREVWHMQIVFDRNKERFYMSTNGLEVKHM